MCAAAATSPPFLPDALISTTYTPTEALLFRYSALTYNAHRIHYDRDWARKVENHTDLVVHGPLTASLLVELAERAAVDSGKQLQSFEYRATNPMYVNQPIRLAIGPLQASEDGKAWTAEAGAEQDGRVGMKATAKFV